MLHPAAVAADELHPRAGQLHVEHPGVGGVGQPQPHHLPGPGGERVVRLAADQQHVAEPAHRRVGGLGRAERGDLAVLQQQVIQGQQDIAVGGRPVIRVGGDDQDVAVQAHLLGVVLADVRVVPVQAGIGEPDPVGELAADRDRGLGLVRDAVVLVLQPQPVPVHGGVQVAVVGHVDDHLRALPHLQGRAGDGAVVAQHPHRGVPEPLGYRADPQVQVVAVGQLEQLWAGRLGQPGGVCREGLGRSRLARLSVLIHDQYLGVSCRGRSSAAPRCGRAACPV